jgi:hypothetical protein
VQVGPSYSLCQGLCADPTKESKGYTARDCNCCSVAKDAARVPCCAFRNAYHD